MKFPAFAALFLAASAMSATQACSSAAGTQDWSMKDLSIASTSFSVDDNGGRSRMLTTLGTLKNASGACLDDIVIEVKYFDDRNALVDTVTEQLYGLVLPAHDEVAFRVHDQAARPNATYATQTVRIITADARSSRSRTQTWPAKLGDLAISWSPMLLLVGLFIFMIRRAQGKNSPQARIHALYARQVDLMEQQSRQFERIAAAVELNVKQRPAGPVSPSDT